jgi:hypothetical protein
MWEPEDEERIEPFRVTPGFIAFLALMFVPVVLGLFIYVAAWMVSDEVYAAEAAQAKADETHYTVPANSQLAGDTDVAGWKKTIVVVCPLH